MPKRAFRVTSAMLLTLLLVACGGENDGASGDAAGGGSSCGESRFSSRNQPCGDLPPGIWDVDYWDEFIYQPDGSSSSSSSAGGGSSSSSSAGGGSSSSSSAGGGSSSSSSSSSGGSAHPYDGNWSAVVTNESNNCGDPPGQPEFLDIELLVSGSTITIAVKSGDATGEVLVGTLSGDMASWTSSDSDGFATDTSDISVTFSSDANSANGVDLWTYTEPEYSCFGTDLITFTRP